MRVLVTGHQGYIGSVLTSVLRHAHVDVVGLDTDLYRGCEFGRTRDELPCFDCDVRDLEYVDLLSFDAVIHLAALPESHGQTEFDPAVVEEVNTAATVRLAELCRKANVERFLFASSCAVYGGCGPDLLDETYAPAPLTPYARSKRTAERELERLASASFTPVMLRNATVFGVAPRLRLDIVLNDFVAAACVRGRIEMKTGGRAWRPLIHVEDLARAYLAVLAAASKDVSGQIFNIAAPGENHRVIDIADAVVEEFPSAIRVPAFDQWDERSYRVSTNRFQQQFPAFGCRWSLRDGIRQLRSAYENAGLTPADWRSSRFRRTRTLIDRIESGDINPDMRTAVAPLLS